MNFSDDDPFIQRIRKPSGDPMPTGSESGRKAARKKTRRSKRVSHQIGQQSGMRHRRQKKVN